MEQENDKMNSHAGTCRVRTVHWDNVLYRLPEKVVYRRSAYRGEIFSHMFKANSHLGFLKVI
jgi:hypothetical protein